MPVRVDMFRLQKHRVILIMTCHGDEFPAALISSLVCLVTAVSKNTALVIYMV